MPLNQNKSRRSRHMSKDAPTSLWRRGGAVVELAFALPFLTILVMGTVEYSQLTHAAQVVSNASRRGSLYAAENQTTSTTAVRSYVREFVADSFAHLSDSAAASAVSVSVVDTSGTAIPNGDLSALGSGTPLVVDVSMNFESIRALSHFGLLNNTQIQTSTVARRE